MFSPFPFTEINVCVYYYYYYYKPSKEVWPGWLMRGQKARRGWPTDVHFLCDSSQPQYGSWADRHELARRNILIETHAKKAVSTGCKFLYVKRENPHWRSHWPLHQYFRRPWIFGPLLLIYSFHFRSASQPWCRANFAFMFQSINCIFHPVTVNFDLCPWLSNLT